MSANEAFALGSPTDTAAGAAIYEPLAQRTPKMVAPPIDRPTQ